MSKDLSQYLRPHNSDGQTGAVGPGPCPKGEPGQPGVNGEPEQSESRTNYSGIALALGFTLDQAMVVNDERDGEFFRDIIDSYAPKMRQELETLWAEYSAPATPVADSFDLDALDDIEIDEEAVAAKQAGGGEAIDEDDADCEGCKI